MRKNDALKSVFIALMIIIVAVSFQGCKKDKEEKTTTPVTPITTQDAFAVETEGAVYVNETFPVASTDVAARPTIDDVNGNSFVITGGTNSISATYSDSQNDAQSLLVGVQGKKGYYRIPIEATKSIQEYYEFVFVVMLDQDFNANSVIFVLAMIDELGNVSEHYTLTSELVEAGTGKLQVNLSWDIDNDLDLHLVQPDDQEIYYGEEVSSNGGNLDIDSNPDCDIDGIRNENITYPDNTSSVQNGEYIVRVDYYSDCDSDTTPVNYIATARYNGEVIPVTSGTNPYYGSFLEGTDDWGGYGDGIEVMRFNINSTAKSAQKMYYWNYKIGSPAYIKAKRDNPKGK